MPEVVRQRLAPNVKTYSTTIRACEAGRPAPDSRNDYQPKTAQLQFETETNSEVSSTWPAERQVEADRSGWCVWFRPAEISGEVGRRWELGMHLLDALGRALIATTINSYYY